ncbi:MAG: SpoIIE family protein phosphatase [Bacteroidota bacterium]
MNFRLFILIIYYLILPLLVVAQNRESDSIRTLLHQTANDTNKVKCLYRLAYLLRSDSSKAAFKYCQQAIYLSKQFNYERGLASAYNNLGAIYDEIGDKEKAVESFVSAFELKKKLKDSKSLATTLANIGVIYKRDKDYKNAFRYYQLALLYASKTSNQSLLDNLNYNIGNLYKATGNNDSALHHYNKVEQNCINRRDTGLYIKLIKQKVYALVNSKKKNDALIVLKNTSANYKDYLIKNNLYFHNLLFAFCYLEKDNIDSAKTYLEKIKLTAKDSSDKEFLLENYELKASYYHKLSTKQPTIQNLKNAYHFRELQLQVINQMNDKQNSKALSNSLLQSEINNMEIELSEIKHKEELAKVKSGQQRLLLSVSIIGLIIISVLSFSIFKKYKVQSRLREELGKKNHIIETKNEEILSSIQYAKRIQYTLLAHEDFLNIHIAEYFIYFKPKDIVSGDFYWAAKKENKFYLAVCDSTGHGVPGAFMCLLNIGFLSEAINEKGIEKPNEVFNFVRQRLIDNISKEGQQDGFDGLLICIDHTTKQITYAAANNNPVLIQNNELVELEADRMPVGIGERKDNFKLHTINAKPGDILYLYTDGYADQFGGPKGKKFKYKQLNELLIKHHVKPLNEQQNTLSETFENWKGDLEQVDDVCVIGLKI